MMKLQCNVGTVERKLRVIAGVAILAIGVYYGSWLGLIGLMPIFTGSSGYCPAYVPFGVSTAKKD
jgi:hypothetical protein